MFEFLGFGRSKPAGEDKPKASAVVAAAAAPARNIDKPREMTRMALSSVLRRNGIPSNWIGCELAAMPQPKAAELILVQLVVAHWHDGLMRYAPELQTELLKEVRLFDNGALASNLAFAWKFAPDCGYPDAKLPEPGFWALPADSKAVEPSVPVQPEVATAAKATPARRFDLPRSAMDDDAGDNGFAATQFGEHH